MKTTKLVAAVCLLACTGAPSLAHAAGLYFSDRGVRPMGRGGAFVAGADDLGATWYNPAGIADAKQSFLVDFAWLNFGVDYTRQLLITNTDGSKQYVNSQTVHGNTPFLPIPTIAGSYVLDKKGRFTLAFGVLAPYVALTSFPTTVESNGATLPSPARYAMGSFNGSLMAVPGVWLAWKPIKQLRFGIGAMALTGTFQTTVTFNASPANRVLGAPEDPQYDAAAQLAAGPIFAPTVNGGVIFAPIDQLRLGISGQGPMSIDAPAHLTMRLPSAPLFDGASQDGTDASIHFVLPAIFRAGIEVRPIPQVRVEAAYVREFWSVQQSINIDMKNVNLDNVGAGTMPPKIAIPDIKFPRGFRDSNSYRIGAEVTYKLGGYRFANRLGFSYETSAVPNPYVSVSSLDFDKYALTFGGSLYIGEHWRFDGLYAHLFTSTTFVNPDTAQIPRINPLQGNPTFEEVNGGYYTATADLWGVGLNYLFK
ncbi:MAG TPA: outer membrane protein transport protein [Polyangiaceae bacterium]